MFPFLPFISFSQCGKCGGNLRQNKLNNNNKFQQFVFSIHNENHAGTSKEYYVTSSYNISPECKIEFLSNSKLMLPIKNNKNNQKIYKNSPLKTLQKKLNTQEIKSKEISNINTIDNKNKFDVNLIYDENFSPFASKGRIRESFERSEIDEADSLELNDESYNLPIINQQKNIIYKEINLNKVLETVTENNELVLKFKTTNKDKTDNDAIALSFNTHNNNKNKEFNSLINLNSLSLINIDDQNQQSQISNKLNLSKDTIAEDKNLPSIKIDIESQNRILSPICNQPNFSNLPLTVNTPPLIQSAQTQQNVFQPSQAMLELFGILEQGKIVLSTNLV